MRRVDNAASFASLGVDDMVGWGAAQVFAHAATRVILSNLLQICNSQLLDDVNADAAYVILKHKQWTSSTSRRQGVSHIF